MKLLMIAKPWDVLVSLHVTHLMGVKSCFRTASTHQPSQLAWDGIAAPRPKWSFSKIHFPFHFLSSLFCLLKLLFSIYSHLPPSFPYQRGQHWWLEKELRQSSLSPPGGPTNAKELEITLLFYWVLKRGADRVQDSITDKKPSAERGSRWQHE